MNAKIAVFVICFEVIIFLLHNLRNGTFETMCCVILSKTDTRAVIPVDMLLLIAFDNSVAKTSAANLIDFGNFFKTCSLFSIYFVCCCPRLSVLIPSSLTHTLNNIIYYTKYIKIP